MGTLFQQVTQFFCNPLLNSSVNLKWYRLYYCALPLLNLPARIAGEEVNNFLQCFHKVSNNFFAFVKSKKTVIPNKFVSNNFFAFVKSKKIDSYTFFQNV